MTYENPTSLPGFSLKCFWGLRTLAATTGFSCLKLLSVHIRGAVIRITVPVVSSQAHGHNLQDMSSTMSTTSTRNIVHCVLYVCTYDLVRSFSILYICSACTFCSYTKHVCPSTCFSCCRMRPNTHQPNWKTKPRRSHFVFPNICGYLYNLALVKMGMTGLAFA